MNTRVGLAATVAIALVILTSAAARAGLPGSGGASPPPTPTPSPNSAANTVVQNGTLQATVSGLYAPVFSGQSSPLTGRPVSPYASGADPQGQPCPPNPTPAQTSAQNDIVWLFTIYPYITKNADGSYTLTDSGYHYKQPVPPGGDPTQTAPGSPATAANIPGNGVAVVGSVHTNPAGTWDDVNGCDANVQWSPPELVGPLPVPSPPATTLSAPPFTALDITDLSKGWDVGSIASLPNDTLATYVNIPTCAWLSGSAVPTSPQTLYSYKPVSVATQRGLATVFLRYAVTVAPGDVVWDFGDGDLTPDDRNNGPQISVGSYSGSPPTYDAVTQAWNTASCTVFHYYRQVAGARTITASETVSVQVSVSWSDGFAVHGPIDVPCPGGRGGDCSQALRWQAAPRAVDQVEAVPFVP